MSKYNIRGIGILGGSFDPAHKGHLAISKHAIKKFRLKKFTGSSQKRIHLKRKHFSLGERMFLIKKIIKNVKKIKILYLDDIIKSSRSIDIIRYILKKKKIKNFILLLVQMFY